MDLAERRAADRQIVNRALEHDCVLFNSTAGEKTVFVWRSVGEQVGPEFAGRELAIDWMAERLDDGHVDHPRAR
jgi:hypothetical protein